MSNKFLRPSTQMLLWRATTCPHCGAPPGELCQTPSGKVMRYDIHALRKQAARWAARWQ